MRNIPLPSPILLTLLLTLTPTLLPAAPPPPPPQPTLADAQADFAAGQYRPALQKIAAALRSPDAKPGSPQRYDLLVLRGESLLRLGERRMAADSFRSAATVAQSRQDYKAMMAPAATALLIGASKGTRYEPKNGEPIDIVDPQSRKRALAAFYNDTLADARPKIDRARTSNSVNQIEALIPTMWDLYVLETAATGRADQTVPLVRPVGQRARDLIHAQLAATSARVDQLAATADEPVLAAAVITPRGLTSPERDELAATADTLLKARRAAQTGRSIARMSDGPVEAWESLLADCNDLRDRAQQLWDRRY